VIPLAAPAVRPRLRVLLWAAAAAGLALAVAPGAIPASLRAGAAACGLGAAALLLPAARRVASTPRLVPVDLQPLSCEAGVALLEVDGRPVLVGFGGCARLLEPGAALPGRDGAAPSEEAP
jgi:flagellar protein FliO/FliZ